MTQKRTVAGCSHGLLTFVMLLAAYNLSGATVRLENPHLVVEIDAGTTGVHSIRDRKEGITYSFHGISCSLTTDRGVWKPTQATRREGSKLAQVSELSGEGFEATLHYQLGPDDHFLEKWIEIRRRPALTSWGIMPGSGRNFWVSTARNSSERCVIFEFAGGFCPRRN